MNGVAGLDALVEGLRRQHRPNWIGWIKREFAPTFGRGTTTMRMVVGVVIVTIVSMTLQVPQAPFSAFIVFFVTKENPILTTATGIIMAGGTTIAAAASLILLHFTFDYPEIRFPVLAAFIFTGMFLSRVFVIGPLGFISGFYIALLQTITEPAPNTDTATRNLLWLYVALLYGVGVTVLLNRVLLPARPWEALSAVFTCRLDATRAALQRVIKEGTSGGQVNPPLMELATRGNATMLSYLNFSEADEPKLKQRHAAMVSTIGATEHVIVATAALEFRVPPVSVTETDRRAAAQLMEEIDVLERAIVERHPTLSPHREPEIVADLPQLRELQIAARGLRESLCVESVNTAPPPPPKRKPMFIPDAFTNPAHVRFALKVTLACMICNLAYNALHWQGISLSFATCCFIALENTGATIRKGLLRLIGGALGGLAGFLAIMYIVPYMQSIVSLVVLVAVVSAICGWAAAGGERIAYGGLQAAFAFYVSLFQGFEPGINFTVIRDRVVGILLGIVVASIIFHFVWPERAIDGLRNCFVRLLRHLSKLLVLPAVASNFEEERKIALPTRREILKDLDDTLRFSELAAIEHTITGSAHGLTPARLELMVARSQMVSLMSVVLLEEVKLSEWQRIDHAAQEAELRLRTCASNYLQQVANYVEGGVPPDTTAIRAAVAAWKKTVPEDTTNDRYRLMRRLAEQVPELA